MVQLLTKFNLINYTILLLVVVFVAFVLLVLVPANYRDFSDNCACDQCGNCSFNVSKTLNFTANHAKNKPKTYDIVEKVNELQRVTDRIIEKANIYRENTNNLPPIHDTWDKLNDRLVKFLNPLKNATGNHKAEANTQDIPEKIFPLSASRITENHENTSFGAYNQDVFNVNKVEKYINSTGNGKTKFENIIPENWQTLKDRFLKFLKLTKRVSQNNEERTIITQTDRTNIPDVPESLPIIGTDNTEENYTNTRFSIKPESSINDTQTNDDSIFSNGETSDLFAMTTAEYSIPVTSRNSEQNEPKHSSPGLYQLKAVLEPEKLQRSFLNTRIDQNYSNFVVTNIQTDGIAEPGGKENNEYDHYDLPMSDEVYYFDDEDYYLDEKNPTNISRRIDTDITENTSYINDMNGIEIESADEEQSSPTEFPTETWYSVVDGKPMITESTENLLVYDQDPLPSGSEQNIQISKHNHTDSEASESKIKFSLDNGVVVNVDVNKETRYHSPRDILHGKHQDSEISGARYVVANIPNIPNNKLNLEKETKIINTIDGRYIPAIMEVVKPNDNVGAPAQFEFDDFKEHSNDDIVDDFLPVNDLSRYKVLKLEDMDANERAAALERQKIDAETWQKFVEKVNRERANEKTKKTKSGIKNKEVPKLKSRPTKIITKIQSKPTTAVPIVTTQKEEIDWNTFGKEYKKEKIDKNNKIQKILQADEEMKKRKEDDVYQKEESHIHDDEEEVEENEEDDEIEISKQAQIEQEKKEKDQKNKEEEQLRRENERKNRYYSKFAKDVVQDLRPKNLFKSPKTNHGAKVYGEGKKELTWVKVPKDFKSSFNLEDKGNPFVSVIPVNHHTVHNTPHQPLKPAPSGKKSISLKPASSNNQHNVKLKTKSLKENEQQEKGKKKNKGHAAREQYHVKKSKNHENKMKEKHNAERDGAESKDKDEVEDFKQSHKLDKGLKKNKFHDIEGHKKGHKTRGYHNKFIKDEHYKVHKIYADKDEKGEHNEKGGSTKEYEKESGERQSGHNMNDAYGTTGFGTFRNYGMNNYGNAQNVFHGNSGMKSQFVRTGFVGMPVYPNFSSAQGFGSNYATFKRSTAPYMVKVLRPAMRRLNKRFIFV